ncbi:MAG: alpha,alpha-trehalase TreF [Bacteroidota bacterium]|jgi:alpha,alpha-trehalase
MVNEYFDITTLSPLYEDVQNSGIFADSKFFVDCIPKAAPDAILQAYEAEKTVPGFDLDAFLSRHFSAPEVPETGYMAAGKLISQHIEQLWNVLLRSPGITDETSTLIPLPHPYVVPGGRFREIYYWDSYFTMLGLQISGREEIVQNMVDNFAFLTDHLGFIPNGNRTYYLSRSQPPFFSLMVNLLSEMKGAEIQMRYRPELEREYEFWMSGESHTAECFSHRRLVALPGGVHMNRYWDDRPEPRPEAYAEDVHTARKVEKPAEDTYRHIRAAAESGWDFSSRWLADPNRLETIQTTDILPVDLNCLLYFLEKTLLNIYRQQPDRVPADVFKERTRKRRQAIQDYFWDDEKGFFFDYNHTKGGRTGVWTLAGVFPLFFGIATEAQAASVARHLEDKFLCPGGLVTTTLTTGQQWDAPNGWAPLQYMACKGLMQYGYTDLADRIRKNWRNLNEKIYADTGKMMEKYNVWDLNQPGGGGEYPNQDGFGWTNGVYLALPYLCPPNSLKK